MKDEGHPRRVSFVLYGIPWLAALMAVALMVSSRAGIVAGYVLHRLAGHAG